MSRDDATILDILRAARRAVAFKHGIRPRSFMHDEKSQSAIVHQLLVLGEATKHLSAEFRAHHREIPWRTMTGMRDTLIYENEEVWKTAAVHGGMDAEKNEV
jgi:uncharacterized protein with HEPN domain